jgi:hypothetical protein
LAELGNSAVSQIEALLREIRRVATDEFEASTIADARTALPPQPGPSTARVESSVSSVSPPAQANVASEHWFPVFIDDLLEAFQSSGRISFETVEGLLHERKEAFMKDLETTRKMYREYPHLFKDKDMRTG